MILTVTLNPAVDKAIQVGGFRIGQVNRVEYSRADVGGKGINVSKTVKVLGGESVAFGFIGGKSGEVIKEYLDSEGIENELIKVAGETRTNIKIIDVVNNTYTDINEAGPQIAAKEIENIKERIVGRLQEDAILVLSGSVPSGVEASIYGELIREAKKLGARVILDADGELFSEGVKQGPYIVKPNIHELETAVGYKIKDDLELIKAARSLMNYGVSKVIVSLDKEGSLMACKEGVFKVKGLQVEVKSIVGAGDSMVGAIAVALERGCDIQEALKLAAAASTACVMTEGSQSGKREVIDRLLEQIEVIRVM